MLALITPPAKLQKPSQERNPGTKRRLTDNPQIPVRLLGKAPIFYREPQIAAFGQDHPPVYGLNLRRTVQGCEAETARYASLQRIFGVPVRPHGRHMLDRSADVADIGLAGIVQQSPELQARRRHVTDRYAVLGDRIELRYMAGKAADVRQRVGDVQDADVLGPRAERPDLAARVGFDPTIGPGHRFRHVMRATKSLFGSWLTCRSVYCLAVFSPTYQSMS